MSFKQTNIQWICVIVLGTVTLLLSGCGGTLDDGGTSSAPSSDQSQEITGAELTNETATENDRAVPTAGSDTIMEQLSGEKSSAVVVDERKFVSDGLGMSDSNATAPMPQSEMSSARGGQQRQTTGFFGESESLSFGVNPTSEALSEAKGKTRHLGLRVSQEPNAAPTTRVATPARKTESPSGAAAAVATNDSAPASPFSLRGRFDQSRTRRSKLSVQQQKVMQMDLQPGEELWIIAKAAPATTTPAGLDTPRCGCLMATLPNETKQVPVPLKHTSVEGNIDGYIASVDVTQQFHNPYDSKIEAVYVFPLPQNAAVNEFVMTVGDRKIRGIIRERQKAEQIYAAARAQGHVAALMTQERPNIFTQKVANIEPGKDIDIDISYFNTLRYDDGAYEFVFPMVVGPRFNPPATTDGVGAIARGQHNSRGQKTEVQYLAPNERNGHDISVAVNISAGVEIEDVNCINHAINTKQVSESERRVTLSAKDTIPNKDFVLRYKVAGDQIKTAMLTHKDENGSYFTMMLYPPADLKNVQRSPMEMVFVLDCSGSMKGKPIAQAKAAISHAMQSLTPRDTFQIIRFSNNASQLGAEPVLATEDNVKRGLEYLASLHGSGGTHMIEGMKAALDFPHDEGRFRLVSFMTDGYIGNEQQILGTLHEKLGASRIFSFGVSSSPNRMLMDRMAVLGRGAVAYLSLNDNATEIMDRFNRRISHPAMTDLSIDWGKMNVTDVYPQRLPDLIVGRPVVLTGRFEGEPNMVTVNGRVDMEATSFAVSLKAPAVSAQHKGIAAVWARLKIKDLMNLATHATDAVEEIHQTVTQTALAYNLMSSFTAFVAVDSMTKTEGDFGTTVAVPVPVPDGVKYETTVGGTN